MLFYLEYVIIRGILYYMPVAQISINNSLYFVYKCPICNVYICLCKFSYICNC